jgi:hypothetical protein
VLRSLALLLCGVVLATALAGGANATPARTAKLTPREQKWVKPLLAVWQAQNDGLNLVLRQAAAPNAFLIGSKPNNQKLGTILGALLSCKKPSDSIKRAGAPPTARLDTFLATLDAACIDDENGAHAFTRAMIAYTANQGPLTATTIKQGIADFKLGSAEIAKAYKSLTALGGGFVA